MYKKYMKYCIFCTGKCVHLHFVQLKMDNLYILKFTNLSLYKKIFTFSHFNSPSLPSPPSSPSLLLSFFYLPWHCPVGWRLYITIIILQYVFTWDRTWSLLNHCSTLSQLSHQVADRNTNKNVAYKV